jgi:hypothetical protein
MNSKKWFGLVQVLVLVVVVVFGSVQPVAADHADTAETSSWKRFELYLVGTGQMDPAFTGDSLARFEQYLIASGAAPASVRQFGGKALASTRHFANSWERFRIYLQASGVE